MVKEREKGLVSIVISNYNNEDYIEECLNSLINQSYKKIEIIIIDDFSTDNSVKIIENWIEKKGKALRKNKKLIFLKMPRNCGFAAAVTTGLYIASGEFIAMQDGDDISNKDRIEKQVKYLISNEEINAVGTDYSIFKDDGLRINTPTFIQFGVEEIKDTFAKGGNAVSHGTLLIRGEVFDKLGGLTRRLDGAEDYEFIVKLLPYGLDNLNEELYMYRAHEKQRSRKFYSKKHNVVGIKKEDLNVLLVLDQFNIGGTETHVLYLAKELMGRGVSVSILGGRGELEPEFRKLNCRVYNVNFPTTVLKDSIKSREYKEMIKKIINIENINLVHLHQSPSGSLVLDVANEMGIASVFTIHGMYYHDIVSTKLPLANEVICVSYPTYEWLLGYGINGKVVANGVNYDEFNEKLLGKNIRGRFGIKNNDFVAMYCSRMAWGKVKTCENLIRVCRDLKREESIEVHALIVGDGPGYKELKNIGDRANKMLGKELIHFTGGQTDLPDFYNCSDFVVGTGRVAIEAMASKKPVIATGNNGYFGLVNEENFDEAWRMYFGDHGSKRSNNAIYLYDDIKKLWLNKKAIDRGLDKVFEKSNKIFEISNIANQVIDIYMEAFQ
ncbi:glycosyltransferase [Clostridium sp. B9]|uniref:glycosyltransferase n=1 Tax=Clostridium sp. B9 TaxID=3423224 RepID=UPI003D2F475E